MVFVKGGIPHNKGKEEHVIRFWTKVKKTDTCWIWIGHKRNNDYGIFSYKQKTVFAHRFAWFLTYGYFSEINICHKCDNPPCVNPAHLFEGTYKDNFQDAMKKGRTIHHKCEFYCWCKKKISKKRKITLEIANQIREKYFSQKCSSSKLANEFSLAKSSVLRIIHNESYRS